FPSCLSYATLLRFATLYSFFVTLCCSCAALCVVLYRKEALCICFVTKGGDHMKDKDTPLRLVRLWEKMNPGVYAELDRCRAEKDEAQMSWPDYCELPIGAAFTYLVDIADMSHVEAAMVAAELTAC